MTWGAPRLGDASFAQLFKEQKIKLARMVNRQRWFGDGLGMVGICKFYCGNCLRESRWSNFGFDIAHHIANRDIMKK